MFIVNPFPEEYTDVDHINGNKSNNKYNNLQWCSNNQNKHIASINGQYEHGENRYNSVYNEKFAREICEKFHAGISYSEVYNYYKNYIQILKPL